MLLPLVAFILLPMLLIILQKETGSALVYLAFFLVLYREGMPGVVLFSGVCAVVYFVVGIRFDQVFIADTPTPIGEFAVLLMILLFAGSMVWVYRKKWEPVRNMIGGSLLVLLIAYLVSEYLSIQFGLGGVGALCGDHRLSTLLIFERTATCLSFDRIVCFGFYRFSLFK